ncbi:hypothetical protein [Collimonas arenae]|nr:hypothetical protein [Collimonas arenae]
MRLAEKLSHAAKYLLRKEAGASLIEVALIGALIVVVCSLVLLALVKNA